MFVFRRCASGTALALALAVAVLVAVLVAVPRVASAQGACDGGALCADDDRDGFLACGCPYAGTPCDCDDADPAAYPGSPEACDAPLDRNCNGAKAERCPAKRGCLGSVCVAECVPLSDFGCTTGSKFATQADGRCLCEPEDCALFGCPPGLTCDDAKKCVPSCHPGVRCPHGQRCRGFGCVDPCAEVTCPAGLACRDGLCVPSCTCCPEGESCDPTAPVPRCIETACVGARCGGGTHCERGACVDDCAGVVCPPQRVCRQVSLNGAATRGTCVDLCSPTPCKPGFACDWRTGGCTPLPIAEGGLTAPEAIDDGFEVGGAGWFCAASSFTSGSAVTAVAGVAGLFGFVVRRRRRRATGEA